MDKYGNIVFQDQSGVRHIPANQWADWAPVIEQKIAAQTAPAATPPGGGGGYPPRGTSSARGGSGGGTTPGTQTIFDSQAHRDTGNTHANQAIGIYGDTNFQPTAPVDGGGSVGQNLGNVPADFTGPQNQPGGQGNTDAQNLGNVTANFGGSPAQGTNSIDDWIRVARQKGLIP
jgi:hypothetical protein